MFELQPQTVAQLIFIETSLQHSMFNIEFSPQNSPDFKFFQKFFREIGK